MIKKNTSSALSSEPVPADVPEPVQGWANIYIFTLLIVPLIGASSLLEPFGRDQGIHATIAYALDQGALTYRDVFNMKPPLTTAVHWLSQALFGHSMMSIRLFDLCAATAAAVGLVAIGRRLGQGLIFGYATPVSFAVIYYSYGYWEHSQTDGWAGFLVVGALVCMLHGWEMPAGWRRRATMAGAGIVLGIAFALKYTIGGAGILIFAPLLAYGTQRFLWTDFIFCILGGAGLLTLLALVMAAFGALGPFLEIQGFILGYVDYSPTQMPGFLAELGLIGIRYEMVPFLVALGAVAALVDAWRRRTTLFLVVVILWVGAGWVSGHVQGKGFFYHYLPMVLPYALLVAAAVAGVARLVGNPSLRKAVVILLLVLLYLPSWASTTNTFALSLIGKEDPAAAMRAAIPKESDFDVEATVEFAQALIELRQPGDGLFVWGYETMLYFLVNEPPRYRYPYAWPFAVDFYDGRYTDDLLMRLTANPPKHFVVQKRDATPQVTNRKESSAELLPLIKPLYGFFQSNYSLVLSKPRFDLYELQTN